MRQLSQRFIILALLGVSLRSGVAEEGIAAGHPGDVGIAADPQVILFADFEGSDWRTPWGASENPRAVTVSADAAHGFVPLAGKALRITVDEAKHYGTSMAFRLKQHLGEEPEELYFRYYLRFANTWQPAQNGGGKLPGIAGTYDTAGWGGRAGNGYNGWSARGLFKAPEGGLQPIGFYCYHADMGNWGANWAWRHEDRGLLENDRWYCIEQHVRLNTPDSGSGEGAKDGVLRGWVDGQLAFEKTDVRFRHTADLKIDRVWIDVYYGGDPTAPQDMHLYMDNLVIATDYIGPIGTGATPPSAPSGLTSSAASTSRIDLAWTDTSSNESGFRVERKIGSSGSWSQIATTTSNVNVYSNTGLAADTTYVYRVRAYNASGDSAYSNEASAKTPGSSSSDQSPYGGIVRAVPGTIEAEHFDEGGQGVAYSDTTSGNVGGEFRSTDVDVDDCADSGGGHHVGWIVTGEWLEYTVDVAASGSYRLDARVASGGGSGGGFRVEFDGVDTTGTITAPVTGGWQDWTTVSKDGVDLSAGQQVMRVHILSGGFNLNWIRFTSESAASDVPEMSAVSITFVGVATHATQVAIGGTTVVPAADGSYSITIAVPEGTTDVSMVTTHSDGSTTTRDITLDSAPAEEG